MRPGLRLALVVFLLLPFWLWFTWIPSWQWPKVQLWLPILFHSSLQAFLSSLVSMSVGFALFSGLQGIRSARWREWAEFLLLVPNMIPPLFLILGLLSLYSAFGPFPFGLGAVVFAHALLNSGLVAIALDRIVQLRCGGMVETAWLLGASKPRFWFTIGIPYLRADLATLFLFVFSLCFTSFAIPLVLGGMRSGSLEVAIYDAIRTEGRWDKALILAMIQSLFLLSLVWLLPRSLWPSRTSVHSLKFLGSRKLIVTVLLPTFILWVGWLVGLKEALALQLDLPWFQASLNSAALGLSVGLLHLFLFALLAFVSPQAWLTRFLTGYLAPSPSLTGFALLLVPVQFLGADFLRLVIALTLITFPLLYRWLVHASLSATENQVRVAELLGATPVVILREIVWPQIALVVFRACGLAAFWAAGDFALSRIVYSNWQSLPLLMDELIGNYRMAAAQLLMVPLLIVGVALYGFFVKAGKYVTG